MQKIKKIPLLILIFILLALPGNVPAAPLTYPAFLGTPSEWGITALYKSGAQYEYDEYAEKLLKGIYTEGQSFTDYLRMMLCYETLKDNKLSSQEKEDFAAILDRGLSDKTLMNYVYALQVKTNGGLELSLSNEEIIQFILTYQKKDGGFALSGQIGDPDVTSMVLLSLAPFKDQYKAVIETAVNTLSKMQRESAGFASYGIENCESLCQVMMALKALCTDYETDTRFIRNNRTLSQELLEYKKGEGFVHQKGDSKINQMATEQAFLALAEGHDEEISGALKTDVNIKLILCVSAAALTVLFSLWYFLKKKKAICLIIFCIGAGLTVFFGFSDIRIDKDESIANETQIKTVITITGPDGYILENEEVSSYSGETAFDQLERALKKHGTDYEAKGGYVRRIGDYAEFDRGRSSGWKYRVNGEDAQKACTQYEMKNGDFVIWYYVLSADEGYKEGDE